MLGRLSIATKTMAIALLPVILLSGLFFWNSARLSNSLATMAGKVTNDLSLSDMDDIAKGVYAMCQAQQELLEQNVATYLNMTEHLAAQAGALSFSADKAVWAGVNQLTKEKLSVELPVMLLGDKPITQNADPNVPALIVDDVKRLTGVDSSLFQRMNAAGDLMRVASTVKTPEGQRAIGTFITAKKPDGTANPAAEAVLAGQPYVGRALVVNTWYVVAYRPLFDAAHNVVGALTVGAPQESVSSLRKQVMATKVMGKGYVFVLDSAGKYVISKDGKQDGQDVSDMKDVKGQFVIQEIVKKATPLGPGEVAQHEYEWKGADDSAAKVKIARLMYFKKWDWIIGASCNAEDFNPMEKEIAAARDRSMKLQALMTLIVLIIVSLITIAFSKRVAKPIIALADRFRELAEGEGDLTKRIDVVSHDETGLMAERFNAFMEKLHSMIRVVGQNSRSMCTASGELASAAGNMEISIESVTASATTVAAAAEEVSASTSSVSRNVDSASGGLTSVATATEEMTATVGEIAGQSEKARAVAMNAATKSDEISVRVRELGVAAEAIEKVTEAITSISAQTNLLALNATIEAARAGAAGKGFAVVASEIKELAQQTASATEDIKQRVAAIQTSASGTVTDIVEISGIIKGVNDIVASIATAIEEQSVVTKDIASSIAMASSEARNASEQVRESSVVSADIAREISQLSSATQVIREGSSTVVTNIKGLTRQAEELQSMVSRFKV